MVHVSQEGHPERHCIVLHSPLIIVPDLCINQNSQCLLKKKSNWLLSSCGRSLVPFEKEVCALQCGNVPHSDLKWGQPRQCQPLRNNSVRAIIKSKMWPSWCVATSTYCVMPWLYNKSRKRLTWTSVLMSKLKLKSPTITSSSGSVAYMSRISANCLKKSTTDYPFILFGGGR